MDKTFLDFSIFSTNFLHHEWNTTRLLSPEIECTSCLISCRTKLQEKLWIALICLQVPSHQSKEQILKLFCEKIRKISRKTFYRKSYFAYIRDFVSNLMSKNVWRNRLIFLTRSRQLDFISFFKDFSISNVPYAPQIHIEGKLIAKNTWIWQLPKNTILQFSVSYDFNINAVPFEAGQYLWCDFSFYY